MNTAPWLDGLSWLVLGTGSLVLLLGAGGILRMPTFYTRIHAASVNETLGAALILAGLALQSGGRIDVLIKLALVLVFLVLTGPVSSHALAQAASAAGIEPGEYRRRREGQLRRPSRAHATDLEGDAPSST